MPPRPTRQILARRAQKGYFTSAAQVTLALVALAVSATAGSLEAARQQAADQIAHVHATYLMKVGADLERALTRAAIDNGLSSSAVRGTIALEGSARSGSQVDLFDRQLGYGRTPQWPSGLLVAGVEGAGSVSWAETTGQVIEVAGVDLAVCRRFNEMLQGTDPERAPPADLETARRDRGWTQGCWAADGAPSGTWFKEAFTDAHCHGSACRSGDVVGAAARRMIEGLPTTPVAVAAGDDAVGDDASGDVADDLDPLAALVACVAREAAEGERDPQVAAARCTVSS